MDGGPEFDKFDRGPVPELLFAGMTLYDGEYHIPRTYLVAPPRIERTVSEHLAAVGVTQYVVSETQKFGHMTYFWNGNRGGMFDARTETYEEIASDPVPFDQRPWMKSAEIADAADRASAASNGSCGSTQRRHGGPPRLLHWRRWRPWTGPGRILTGCDTEAPRGRRDHGN
jgi:bisphosphoglycerate-independent phosphoglycerate mutase (AlkP superfamily)